MEQRDILQRWVCIVGTEHRAIKLTPYEAVYGIKPHREIMNSNAEENTQNHSQEENEEEVSGNDEEPPKKRQKIIENQTKYNTDIRSDKKETTKQTTQI